MELNGKQIRLGIKIKGSKNKVFIFEGQKLIRHQMNFQNQI
jgi:hypothetical protein